MQVLLVLKSEGMPLPVGFKRIQRGCSPVLAAAFMLTAGLACGQAPCPVMTQHRINEMAASLDQLHRSLVDDPHLRLPGESINAYCLRMASKLPKESPAEWQNRQALWQRLVLSAARATQCLRTAAKPHNTSAANLSLWASATTAARALGQDAGRLDPLYRTEIAGASRSIPAERAYAAGTATALIHAADLLEALRAVLP